MRESLTSNSVILMFVVDERTDTAACRQFVENMPRCFKDLRYVDRTNMERDTAVSVVSVSNDIAAVGLLQLLLLLLLLPLLLIVSLFIIKRWTK
jgi:hypothetical protein